MGFAKTSFFHCSKVKVFLYFQISNISGSLQWIWQGKARKDPDIAVLYKHLKHGRRRRKRGNYNDSRGILTDRATLLAQLKKVDTRKQMLARVPKLFIKTMTVDHDKGCANHAPIAKTLDANVYFTRPYTSQDKGTVENRIGVIRQFFPKGTDLRNVTEERIKTVERYLNNRPIRKFDYLSPIQQTLKHRAVALVT